MPDAPTIDDMLDAVHDAYAKARADHDSGACKDSEWSCSYCEAEQMVTLVGADEDRQYLLTIGPNGMWIAVRGDQWETWGRPVRLLAEGARVSA